MTIDELQGKIDAELSALRGGEAIDIVTIFAIMDAIFAMIERCQEINNDPEVVAANVRQMGPLARFVYNRSLRRNGVRSRRDRRDAIEVGRKIGADVTSYDVVSLLADGTQFDPPIDV